MVTLAAVSDQFRHQWVGWRSRQPRLQEIQVIDIGTHTRFIRQTESIFNDEGISPLIWVDGGFATAVRRVCGWIVGLQAQAQHRSEERRVGYVGDGTCRFSGVTEK